MFHDGHELLLAPMHQIGGAGMAEAQIATPLGGPDQMEHTVRPAEQAGVAHQLAFAYPGLQEMARHIGPPVSIHAVGKP